MSSREIPNIHYFNRKDFLEDAQWTESLKTDIEKRELINKLDVTFLTFGSCFAVNLKKVLNRFGFDVYYERDGCNHYSTDSLQQLLGRLKDGKKIADDSLYYFNEEKTDVVAFEYFGVRYYGKDARERCLAHAEKIDKALIKEIKSRDIFIVTLGTSLSFRHNNGKVISALKGMPLDVCTPNLQSVSDVNTQLESIYESLIAIRGDSKFKLILTVSPQRYNWQKEFCGKGFLQYHNISKSTLLLAVNDFVSGHNDDEVIYFPSYELVMDELRLYESLSTYDHLHINQDLTPKYVVKRFLNTFASEGIIAALVAMENLRFLIYFTKERQEFGATLDSSFILPQWQKHMEAVDLLQQRYGLDGLKKKASEELERLSVFDNKQDGLVAKSTTSVLANYMNNKPYEKKVADIDKLTSEKVVVYGASEYLDSLARTSPLLKKNIVAIVDKQIRSSASLYGIPCYPPEKLTSIDHDAIVIASLASFGEIQNEVRALGINSPCL
jgi:hypothetical protein